MKKLYSLLIFFLFAACSSDDNSAANNMLTENDLIGTWSATELYTENATINGTYNNFNLNGNTVIVGSSFNTQIFFTDTPKTVTPTGNFILSATINSNGISQTIEENVDQIPNFSGNWNLSNSVLTITENGISVNFTVISFNDNTLKLKSTINDYEYNFQGINATVTGDLFITLVK